MSMGSQALLCEESQDTSSISYLFHGVFWFWLAVRQMYFLSFTFKIIITKKNK